VAAGERYSETVVAHSALDRATLDLLDKTIEVEMRTPRRDGSISRRPIWVVVVDGDAYVRSYRGQRGAWYRRTLADGGAAISVDAQSIDVGVEQAGDEDVNRRVSGAFRAKYGARSPGPTETMVSPEVSQTTLRLTRSGSAP
jgi:hypothetical protein